MSDILAKSPITGEILGRYLAAGESTISVVMTRARAAAVGWARNSVQERIAVLAGIRARLARNPDSIVEMVTECTGKPDLEALIGDILPCVEGLAWLERNATELLKSEARKSSLLFSNSHFTLEYVPYGVVVILAPWNAPLHLSLIPAALAIAAGNAVIIKPSELTPSIGDLLLDLARGAGLEEVMQVVQGGAKTAQFLIQARPDRLYFTGSAAAGREVLKSAAELLIPVDLALGGKDPMIVFADAPFERSVGAAVHGAFSHAGQACASVERLFIERPLHRRFIKAVRLATEKLRLGSGRHADLGPVLRPERRALIDAHLDDALKQGARIITPRHWEGHYMHPVVLTEVTPSMRIMREETFGPVLPIMVFDAEEQAVVLANGSPYALNASVWSRDLKKARRVAQQLVVGSCAINDIFKSVGNPHIPFGGAKHSGFGRLQGPEGLRAFCRQQTVMENDGRRRREMSWFPYTARHYNTLKATLAALHSEGTVRAKAALSALFEGWRR